ncbi:septum formation initiator family protein [Alicyclobacillus tolerans]|uniref:septum formation initiator family protein n=1 Tax=Alicyclobacillus tolerans TaxID=90970 RepID=UPI001F15A265|nr:septum formation initiator family protein [Alicyclobacillus tolerans]MCF8566312.1 septum formation initiator family protein [Alicyclobacillus tolerans]
MGAKFAPIKLPPRASSHVSRKQRQQAGARHKWLKLRYVAVAVVVGWAGFYYIHTLSPQLTRLEQKQQQLQQQLASMNKQKAQLQQKIQELKSDTYVARYANQHYNLTLPGQVPFDVQH